MPPDAVKDFRQAGKCLAFDLDTSAGFHVIRAAETLIRKYYSAVTGVQEMKSKDRNWGAYVRNLKSQLEQGNKQVNPKIIALIDQVREHHRNPVMHPEVTLSPAEALSLFNIAQSVIISLATELTRINPGGQLALSSPAGLLAAS